MVPLLLVSLLVHASAWDLLLMQNFISSECLLTARYGYMNAELHLLILVTKASFVLNTTCNLLKLSGAFAVVSYPWNSVMTHLTIHVHCIQAPFMSLLTTNVSIREIRESKGYGKTRQYIM